MDWPSSGSELSYFNFYFFNSFPVEGSSPVSVAQTGGEPVEEAAVHRAHVGARVQARLPARHAKVS